jgi:hypothetical protein
MVQYHTVKRYTKKSRAKRKAPRKKKSPVKRKALLSSAQLHRKAAGYMLAAANASEKGK